MAGVIPESKIVEVSQAADIVEVITQYLPLKKSGKNFMGLCPFHKEKTPSFSVSPARQLYHCFGCGAGGNVFTFLMAQEKVSFVEAVRMVAKRYGIALPEASEGDSAADERNQIYDINRWAADAYHEILTTLASAEYARDYVRKRGISAEFMRKFRLGFAPDGWRTLVDRARRAGKSLELLEKAGLARKSTEGDSLYDLMRNRLIFPICDFRGRVVGFGGRTLGDDTVKYLNTPETSVFSKGRNLYGFHLARDKVSSNRRVGIVEGYTDVIMAHQHGFDWIVGTLGTALTTDHVSFLKRYAHEVVLIFDGDTQGLKAADRGLEVLISEGMDIKIAVLPEAEDPCDFLISKGPDNFQSVLDGASDIFNFKIAMLKDKYDFADISQKTSAIQELVESLSLLPDPIKLDLLVTQTAREMGVTEFAIRSHLKKVKHAGVRRQRDGEAPLQATRKTALRRCEEEIIGLMLERNDFIGRVATEVPLESFTYPDLRKVATAVYRLYASRGSVSPADVAAVVEDSDLAACVAGLVSAQQERGNQEKQKESLDQLIKFIQESDLKRKRMKLRERLVEARRRNEEWEGILRESAALIPVVRRTSRQQ